MFLLAAGLLQDCCREGPTTFLQIQHGGWVAGPGICFAHLHDEDEEEEEEGRDRSPHPRRVRQACVMEGSVGFLLSVGGGPSARLSLSKHGQITVQI